jgi:hypothetical protein
MNGGLSFPTRSRYHHQAKAANLSLQLSAVNLQTPGMLTQGVWVRQALGGGVDTSGLDGFQNYRQQVWIPETFVLRTG